mgnify:CR=1 FL=1
MGGPLPFPRFLLGSLLAENMEQDTQQYGRCQICAQQEKSRLLTPQKRPLQRHQ